MLDFHYDSPSMTWRDMQHIVVETAKPDNLNAADWVSNGVGKKGDVEIVLILLRKLLY